MTALPRQNAVSPDEVRAVFGDLEPPTVTAIIETGATSGELVEAKGWLDSDDYLGGTLGKPGPSAVVRQVCDLVAAEQEDEID